ncbi:class D sortase [Sediminibacillus halophilus]|uniref:Sortase A n=1 Tax=Sediminibacillus halophilus TaxID=482461 RepID=A0A1G9TAE1_9BACI|nr:sortase A [Sediminibacillus halophilus]
MRGINRKTGIVLLFIGLILLSIPLYYEWKNGQEVAAMEKALTMVSESQGEPVELDSIEKLTVPKEQLNDVLDLEIPAIDLKQKVLPKTTEENLNVALTQIKQDQTLGEGNFTIAGHRGYRNGRYFSNLPDVPIGADIIVSNGGQKFVYEVKSLKKIKPTNVDILEDDKVNDKITLITCTTDGKKRIAVQGILK